MRISSAIALATSLSSARIRGRACSLHSHALPRRGHDVTSSIQLSASSPGLGRPQSRVGQAGKSYRPDVDLEFALPVLYSMIEGVINSFDVKASRRRVDKAVRQLTLLHWHSLYPIEPDELAVCSEDGRKGSARKR